MKRFVLIPLFIALFLMTGCGATAPEGAMSAVMPTVVPAAESYRAEDQSQTANQADGQTLPTQQGRKVVYNADLTLIVPDTEAAAKQVTDMATALGGYVSGLNAYRSGADNLLYYNVTLRIPAENFEAARETLRKLALRVENDNISTDDVTDRYIDLDARLKTLRATETELQALLTETRERGGKVEDIMSIYRELTNIRAEIENIQGQLNMLDKLAALSTISVNLQPDELSKPIQSEWRPLETLRGSFRTLISVLRVCWTSSSASSLLFCPRCWCWRFLLSSSCFCCAGSSAACRGEGQATVILMQALSGACSGRGRSSKRPLRLSQER